MESLPKRHPALTILVVALLLWFALSYWKAHHAPAATGGGATGAGSAAPTPQTPAQKIAAGLDKAQSWLAKAAIVVPPLALLTPKVATDVYHEVADFFNFGGGGFSIEDAEHLAEGKTVPLSHLNHDIPGVPGNAQVDSKGEISFDGTTTASYVAAWRQMGLEVYVSGNTITLKPSATAASELPGIPPIAPPPAAA